VCIEWSMLTHDDRSFELTIINVFHWCTISIHITKPVHVDMSNCINYNNAQGTIHIKCGMTQQTITYRLRSDKNSSLIQFVIDMREHANCADNTKRRKMIYSFWNGEKAQSVKDFWDVPNGSTITVSVKPAQSGQTQVSVV